MGTLVDENVGSGQQKDFIKNSWIWISNAWNVTHIWWMSLGRDQYFFGSVSL
jgi:hypothetical protein